MEGRDWAAELDEVQERQSKWRERFESRRSVSPPLTSPAGMDVAAAPLAAATVSLTAAPVRRTRWEDLPAPYRKLLPLGPLAEALALALLSALPSELPLDASRLLSKMGDTFKRPFIGLPTIQQLEDAVEHINLSAKEPIIRTAHVPLATQYQWLVLSFDRQSLELCLREHGAQQKEGDKAVVSAITRPSYFETPSTSDVTATFDVVETLLNAKSYRDSTQSITSASASTEVDRGRQRHEDLSRPVCSHETLSRCGDPSCGKLHYRPVMTAITDESLGMCARPADCPRMATACRYVHRIVDRRNLAAPKPLPPQWINCDVRQFDMSILGKFDVIMADPPWFIRQKLPYGTMSDEEMAALPLRDLVTDGYMFLWVTMRTLELGRELLALWGFERVDEVLWIKTNAHDQLMRDGRTGHWLNHSKEHCLVGVKGNPRANCGIDTDVIVAPFREPMSRKPDEIYGMIDRLMPNARKLEIFGRDHNVREGWLTLGNQLSGVSLHDRDLILAYNRRYPQSPVPVPP